MKKSLNSPEKKLYKVTIGAVYMDNSEQPAENLNWRSINVIATDVKSACLRVRLTNRKEEKEFIHQCESLGVIDKM